MHVKMKFFPLFFLLLPGIMIFSCNAASTGNRDVTNDYFLITTAIRTSKASRNEFQEKFAIALDSFFVKDNPSVNLNELNLLLQTAGKENIKAEALLQAANEIDSSLLYKARALKMFKLLDKQYNTVYPEILTIMGSTAKNKKGAIAQIIVPAADALKILAKNVVYTADSVVKKYNLKLLTIDSLEICCGVLTL